MKKHISKNVTPFLTFPFYLIPPPSPQSKLGHLTLMICTAHGYIYGWNKFLRPSTYKWYTPPGYMLCLIVPSVVLVLKFLLLLPCVDRAVMRIRQGWERTQPKEMGVNNATNLWTDPWTHRGCWLRFSFTYYFEGHKKNVIVHNYIF